jgi:hypothetical protein
MICLNQILDYRDKKPFDIFFRYCAPNIWFKTCKVGDRILLKHSIFDEFFGSFSKSSWDARVDDIWILSVDFVCWRCWNACDDIECFLDLRGMKDFIKQSKLKSFFQKLSAAYEYIRVGRNQQISNPLRKIEGLLSQEPITKISA